MADRVKPLKFESPDSGGTELDEFQTSLDPSEDHLDARGVFIQNDTSDDEAVHVTRDAGGNMQFKDAQNTTYKTLTELLAGSGGLTESAHRTLRQLIHFIDDGPAEGFVSGAYREVLPAGDPFPTSIIWYEDGTKAKKIVELALTWSGPVTTQEVWRVYDTDGSTVLATVTDTITNSGIFETSRTRAIA